MSYVITSITENSLESLAEGSRKGQKGRWVKIKLWHALNLILGENLYWMDSTVILPRNAGILAFFKFINWYIINDRSKQLYSYIFSKKVTTLSCSWKLEILRISVECNMHIIDDFFLDSMNNLTWTRLHWTPLRHLTILSDFTLVNQIKAIRISLKMLSCVTSCSV